MRLTRVYRSRINDKPLTAEQRKLVEDHYHLVQATVKRMVRHLRHDKRGNLRNDDVTDATSFVTEKLIRAAQLYKPGRCTFKTYAIGWMRWGVQQWRFSELGEGVHAYSNTLHMASEEGQDGDDGRGILAILLSQSDKNVAEISDELESVRRLVGPRRYKILHSVYVEGKTLAEVGREHGVCKERVRQICVRCSQLARQEAGKAEAWRQWRGLAA